MNTAFSTLSTDPLLSCIITLYTLILLYFPPPLRFTFSPVLVLTAVLLLSLLRLGAVQKLQSPITAEGKGVIEDGSIDHQKAEKFDSLVEKWMQRSFDPNPKPDFEGSFIEWNVGAPLEVIYEGHEGEEEGEDHQDPDPNPTRSAPSLDRYPSLSMFYPESDSDYSSDGALSMTGEWESPESICFTWEDEDKEGSLIEIALDKKDSSGFHFEEDNLIEIDISKNDLSSF
ncbi:hypothetical protein Tsubulata_028993 [Turnera subulata]|uniref:Uncharacterized protein n=1 Tax=Turnera subulata TaxID=218843 RepID=A0A9Q0F501_9ROSI|nr:hypothetical protein Tsubulata_028993 [Turnera subulata]